jgi:plasmid stability protein
LQNGTWPEVRVMPSLTIKGIPDKLLGRLKRRALLHRRSLNGEVITCLEQAASAPLVDPKTWLAEGDRLRTRVALSPLTEATIRKAKAKGRP